MHIGKSCLNMKRKKFQILKFLINKLLLVLLLIVLQLNEDFLYVVLVVFQEYDLIHQFLPIKKQIDFGF